MNDKKAMKKRKEREERIRLGKGKTDMPKGFTKAEKKKGLLGIVLIIVMASAAAMLGLYQLSQ